MASPASDRSRLRSLMELIRLPNIFTAMADSAMGVFFVRADQETSGGAVLVLILAASSLLYAAGVALNDVFDAELDARERPERPIPSGRIPLPVARLISWELLLLGSTAAWFAAFFVGHLGPGIVVTLLIACIVVYNKWLKLTPLGPVAMGSCRALNVLLGMSAAAEALGAPHFLVAGAIGVYIAGVTFFARTEASVSSRPHLVVASLVMLGGPALLAMLPRVAGDLLEHIHSEPIRWYLLMLILATMIGWRCLRAISTPTPVQVRAAVSYGILTVVVLDAACCFAVRDVLPAAAIVSLLLPSIFFSQWFNST
jgi:4-hydroxybenzoate polyprenyltransferase